MKLSIVIPAYNEEERLPPVLESYARFFSEKMGDEAEIIVVVNGSNDRTTEVSLAIARDYPSIKVIDEPSRIGKGGAVIVGIKQAIGEWKGFVDADGATAPEEFYRLFSVAQGTDGVIGSRWMEGSSVQVSQKAMRLVSSRLFNGLIRLLLGLKYKDTQCGAKILTSQAWAAILPDIGVTRFAFDVDLLFQLKLHGFEAKEEPTVWKDVAGSKIRFFNSSFDMFCAVMRMRLVHSPAKPFVGWYDRTLSRTVEFFLRDDLFRHASLLFFASIIASVGNVGFQMVVADALNDDEYELLAVFLALFAIVARPLGSLSTGINHYTSVLVQAGRQSLVPRLLIKWSLLTGCASMVLSMLCILFAPRIAEYFYLERVAPVYVSALALPAIFIAPVLGGTLQGLQRFVWSSVSSISNALGRVVLAAVLVFLLFPTCGWALAGHVGGMYLAVLVSLVALLPLFKNRETDGGPVPSMRLYLFQCVFVQISLAVLMTVDVVLVKRFLPETVGFAKAATLSRMVAFMAAAVAMAMFPKVSSADGGLSNEHRRIYLHSQLYTTLLIGVSLAVCIVFPAPMLRYVLKVAQPSGEILSYTRWMALVMAAPTLLNINVSLLMAQRRFRLLSIVVGCALFYLVGAYLFHESAYDIVLLAGIANGVALLVTTIGILKWREARGEEAHQVL